MGRSSFEFEDSDSEAHVRDLGKKLLQTAKQQDIKKDVLVKLLKVRAFTIEPYCQTRQCV